MRKYIYGKNVGKGYKGTTIEKFFRKVNKKTDDDCWLWIAGLTSDNYGSFYFNKKHMKAHKVSFILHKGKVPKGLCVLHICDNPPCVNPKHLWLGTQIENIKDRDLKGRSKRNKLGQYGK